MSARIPPFDMRALAALLVLAVTAQAVKLDFSSGLDGWVHSQDAKYASAKFVVDTPEPLKTQALKVPEKAKHYGISSLLPEPVDPAQGLVLQYELKLTNGLSCGGAYLKFVTADGSFTPEGLKDDTPYTVMFGPDKCGATNKVHLILRHKSPKTGKIEEKHLSAPPSVLTDGKTHVYTAILRTDNTYAILIDGEEKKAGSLFEDFEPAINPPETIPDPEDSKPSDWVDEAKIPDPDAKKPDDWDEDAPKTIPDEEAKKPEGWLDEEPAEIDDPEATKPEDWDDEEDGEWEPPKVANPKCKGAPGCGEWKRPVKPNPAYKGKWSAPLIDNPAYKGVWKPRDIPNPDYVKDPAPLTNIGKVGAAAIEIWTMDDGYYFDAVVVSNSEAEAAEARDSSWKPKKEVEDAKEAEEQAKAEAEAKKKAEEEQKKAAKAKSVEDQFAALVPLVFDSPVLKPLAAQLAPVRAFFEAQPVYLLAALVAIGVTPLALLLSRGGKKKVADGKAKKEDVTEADDDEESEEEEGEQPPAAKKNGKKAAAEEIEEESEEEEQQDKGKTTRRRARRD